MLRMLLLLLVPVGWAISAPAALLPLVELDPGTSRIALDGSFEYLPEPRGLEGIHDLLARPVLAWNRAPSGTLNLGYRSSPYWLRLRLHSRAAADGSWLIELGSTSIERVDFYLVRGARVLSRQSSGASMALAERPRPGPFPIFALSWDGNEPVTAYLRIQSRTSIQVPLTAWRSDAFQLHLQRWILLQGGFFGAMLVMAAYNLILYLGVREPSYLAYSGFVLLGLWLHSVYRGFEQLVVPASWPPMRPDQMSFFIFLYILAAIGFSRRFLQTMARRAGLDSVLRWTGLIAIAAAIASLILPYPAAIRLSILFTVWACGWMLAAGVLEWSRGNRVARAYTIAWMGFLVGTVLFVLMKLGWLPHNPVTEYAMQAGTFLDVTLLSLALSQRLTEERDARMDAQRHALEAEQRMAEVQASALQREQDAISRLESQVQRRTEALRHNLRRLKQANTHLRDLSARDALTGLSNRRHFDRRFQREWRRAERYGHSLSLVLLDLDRFKRINDTLGHPAGDLVLRRVAALLGKQATRPADVVARYGGEEFAVLLPHLAERQALAVAEQIRTQLERLRILFDGQPIQITASLGVTSVIPTPRLRYDAAVRAADLALYEAKRAGRNGVRFLAPDRAAGLSSFPSG